MKSSNVLPQCPMISKSLSTPVTTVGFLLANIFISSVSIHSVFPEMTYSGEGFVANITPCNAHNIVGLHFCRWKVLVTTLAKNIPFVNFGLHVLMNLFCKEALELTNRASEHPVVMVKFSMSKPHISILNHFVTPKTDLSPA